MNVDNPQFYAWRSIESAPLDGTTIRVRSPEYGEHLMFWAKRSKRWEAVIFMPMRSVRVWWDESAEQPTEWAPALNTVP